MQNQKTPKSSKDLIPKTAQKELTDLLGEKNVCFTRELLSVYRVMAWGPWIRDAINPHGMVQPKTVEEVQGIMKIANKYKIPTMVVGSSGPAVCINGGLIVDSYSRMRTIHKIDPEGGFALIEPGVTNGELLKALRPLGYWVSFGSYPPTISCLANLVPMNGYTNVMGKEHDYCIGVEVVLPTGEVVRTGPQALGYEWWADSRGIHDLRDIWVGSLGTMGIITKAAVRIHPLGESSAIVISGFSNFENAIKWTHKISREAMVNTSMVWGYRWVQWQNYAHEGGKGFMKYINEILTQKPDESPPEFYPQYAFASISGFKEQVEGNVKACERTAKELGGEIINEKFKEQWPETWKKWENMFVKHINPGMALRRSHVYGIEASEHSFTLNTNIKDASKVHQAIMKYFYEDQGIKHVRYYTRQYDHGRVSWIRYVFMTEKFDMESRHYEEELGRQLHDWTSSEEFKRKFPNTMPISGPQSSDDKASKKSKLTNNITIAKQESNKGYFWLYKKLQKTIDPNNIMDPATKRILRS
jgi:FAD/FMN-containing dehydrogenase